MGQTLNVGSGRAISIGDLVSLIFQVTGRRAEIVTDDSFAAEPAIPVAAVVQDELSHIFFRRDPSDPDKVIRVEGDFGQLLGLDNEWAYRAIKVGGNYGALMASAALVTAPLILTFLFARRAFLRGITMTGLR